MQTVMLDKGLPLCALRDLLGDAGQHITMAKIGWGIAREMRLLESRVALYHFHKLPVFPGGTLFEYHHMQCRTGQYFDWLLANGFRHVEISDGVIDLSMAAKRDMIRGARSRGLVVISEVGKKNPLAKFPPDDWRRRVEADLESGAAFVQCEGRETGTVGLYDAGGNPQEEILDALEPLADKVIFEAPTKSHQVAMMDRFGLRVNLGNVPCSEVLPLATLRCGLRAETLERIYRADR